MKTLLTITLAAFAAATQAQSTEAYFDSNGVKIHYVTEGEGQAVILVHGWMSDATMWGSDGKGNAKLSPLPGFKLIALDCRGHGKSDKPHDQGKYGVEMAKDVVRLMDHLKVQKAHLMGYSMGAFIVGKVAATHPTRVLSAIYGGQAPLIVGAKAGGSNEVETFAKAVDAGKGLGPYLLEVWPSDKAKPSLDQANMYATMLYGKKDVKAWAVSGLSLGDLTVTKVDLAKCKAPAMFIYGSKEPDRLKQRVADLRKLLGQVDVKVVEGADHVSTLTRKEFGTAVVDFLQAHKVK